MKKNFKYFGITWLVGFALFNAITFLIPNEVFGVTRFDKGIFWVVYVLITLSFIVQLISAYKFIKADSNETRFLNVPLVRTGYIAIIISIIVGLIFMVFPVLPAWIGAIVCLLVAGYFVIACVKAESVASFVLDIDKKVKDNTSFIKNAVIVSANLVARATTDEIRTQCQKVYEAFCYSDYVSTNPLKDIEQTISDALKKLTFAVGDANYNAVKIESENLLTAIKERNNLCRLHK